MKIKLLFFGITTDLVGKNSMFFHLLENATIKNLKERLITDYKSLANIDEFAVAVNENYANDDQVLKDGDIVAIIPPVSGG
jgi:molybdopterin converting factor subunit 1